jgi:hypothetical protein
MAGVAQDAGGLRVSVHADPEGFQRRRRVCGAVYLPVDPAHHPPHHHHYRELDGHHCGDQQANAEEQVRLGATVWQGVLCNLGAPPSLPLRKGAHGSAQQNPHNRDCVVDPTSHQLVTANGDCIRLTYCLRPGRKWVRAGKDEVRRAGGWCHYSGCFDSPDTTVRVTIESS